MTWLTSSSARVRSPITMVRSPLPWNTAQDVNPWKGSILTPSTVMVSAVRGTDTLTTPAFTSGSSPVILPISPASGPAASAGPAARSASSIFLERMSLSLSPCRYTPAHSRSQGSMRSMISPRRA